MHRCPKLHFIRYGFFKINFELNDILLSSFNDIT